MAAVDMDFNQLEAFLSSQTKKKSDHALTSDQAKVITKFWKNHKSKIHESVVAESSWGNRLRNFNCRLDVKTQSRLEDEIGTPVVLVEMQVGRERKKPQIVRFEMEDNQLSDVIKQMQNLETQLAEYCNQHGSSSSQ